MQLREAQFEQFPRGPAEQGNGGIVGREDVQGAALDHPDRMRVVFEQGAMLGFAFAHRLFQPRAQGRDAQDAAEIVRAGLTLAQELLRAADHRIHRGGAVVVRSHHHHRDAGVSAGDIGDRVHVFRIGQAEVKHDDVDRRRRRVEPLQGIGETQHVFDLESNACTPAGLGHERPRDHCIATAVFHQQYPQGLFCHAPSRPIASVRAFGPVAEA